MVGALLVLGLAGFVDGVFRGSVGLQVLGMVCLCGGILLFAIKVGEEIQPVRAKWGIANEVGVVVNEVGKGVRGTVRVRSELWSATSETRLGPGTKVRVTKVEGLLAWVKKLDEEDGVS
jgi:membrane protein implicated in regulation of membrane protease activity